MRSLNTYRPEDRVLANRQDCRVVAGQDEVLRIKRSCTSFRYAAALASWPKTSRQFAGASATLRARSGRQISRDLALRILDAHTWLPCRHAMPRLPHAAAMRG